MQDLPITEKEISAETEAPVYAPILCASLDFLGLDQDKFLAKYRPSFEGMPWDMYDVKRKQWEAMPSELRTGKEAIFRKYYQDSKADFEAYKSHFGLDPDQEKKLAAIHPWRRRSVCSFAVFLGEEVEIERIETKGFEQLTEEGDIRSLPRIFEETSSEWVDDELFFAWLKAIANYAQKVTPHIDIKRMKLTAHFMSVKARQGTPGNNSPEGAHEDGADFIVSATVINRLNIKGGKSQVMEKMEDGSLEIIFERELQPGEFLFQADTGEEKHYGNDLWHYVTPFFIEDETQEAWRDVIGLDIEIL